VPTIADLLPGADWAEREIRDYYGVEFAGREATPTLMLRPGDPAGLFTATRALGRDTDPARTARAATDSTDSTGSTDSTEEESR
jgi:Ni,Fe-hydrogenase III component G